MTTRELWQNIMHYREFDRMPVIHWTGWPETIERWKREGLPEGVNIHEFLGAVPMWAGVGGQSRATAGVRRGDPLGNRRLPHLSRQGRRHPAGLEEAQLHPTLHGIHPEDGRRLAGVQEAPAA
jgi:hypothetical protein